MLGHYMIFFHHIAPFYSVPYLWTITCDSFIHIPQCVHLNHLYYGNIFFGPYMDIEVVMCLNSTGLIYISVWLSHVVLLLSASTN